MQQMPNLFSRAIVVYDPNYPDLFSDQFASEMKQAEEKRDEAVA